MNRMTIPLYAIRHQKLGGTEYAIYNMIRGLAQCGIKVDLEAGRAEDLAPEFRDFLASSNEVTLTTKGGVGEKQSFRFLEEALFELRRSEPGWVVYPNYFYPFVKPPRRGTKTAVILHDIQYKVFPQFHSAKRKAWLNFYLPRMFQKADAVIVISDVERALVRQYFGSAAADKCSVVWNAIDWERFGDKVEEPSADHRALLEKPFILSVFHHRPHKNVETLIEAFVQIAPKFPEINLYLIGTVSQLSQEFIAARLPEALTPRVKLLGFVSDHELGLYYDRAKLFALPTLYEGFGMPAVEALGLGVPTLVSEASALPEVTLGLAQYVKNPRDPNEWSAKIEELLRSGEKPSDQVVQRVRKTFSPRESAAKLIDVLEHS